MFEIIGLAATNNKQLPHSRSIDSSFSKEPWSSQKEIIKRKVERACFRTFFFSRMTDPPDYAELDNCHLFLVGEAFARIQTRGCTIGTGRISAKALLKTYLAEGSRLLDGIKGNFTIVILNERSFKHQILSSRSAISPLYYAWVDGVFYFSTSVAEIESCLPTYSQLDLAAVVETVLLNWPMNERTFSKQVKRVSPYTILTISSKGILNQPYWDTRNLYGVPIMEVSKALEYGSDLFHLCVNNMVADQPKICASFTSGFDSRALHSVLEKDHSQVLSYAFGIPGSVNVSIPKRICLKLGYPFKPIYLDKSYEDQFDKYAHLTVILSEGLVVNRANYPYAFHQLSTFAPVVITGIFGSEMLRTFQNVGNLVSKSFIRLNQSEDVVSELRRVISENIADSYLTPEVYSASREGVETDVLDWFKWSSNFGPNQRLYLYLISEANRKWFGAELSTERAYATNRFPYLDDEFVEFIFKAPFAGVYSQPITPTITNRFNSQYFYAYLIRKYRPELLHYPTDHGYSPADLFKAFPLLRVGTKYSWSRFLRRLTRYREFRDEEWTERLYSKYLFKKPSHNGLFSPKLKEDFQSGKWKINKTEFSKAASLKLYLDLLGIDYG